VPSKPVGELELRELLLDGEISPDALVWTAGMEKWQSAAEAGLVLPPRKPRPAAGPAPVTPEPVSGAEKGKPGAGTWVLPWRLFWDGPPTGRFDLGEVCVLGREPPADLVVQDVKLSRRHLRLTRHPEGYLLEDLGSSNGTFVAGQPLQQPMLLRSGAEFAAGETTYRLVAPPKGARAPQPAAPPVAVQPVVSPKVVPPDRPARAGTWKLVASSGPHAGKSFVLRDSITLGREEDNGIPLSDPSASRHHARIDWVGEGYQIKDLGSGNGTLVSGQRIAGPHPLKAGDRFSIGASTFELGWEP
jgi:pSer/pThr/pTyr-binding forkhead associated (FHA) protein